MSFLGRLVSDNSKRLENFQLGHCPPQTPLRNKFLHGVYRYLFMTYLYVRFDLSSSINFIDINGFTKLGAQNPY